MDQHKKQDLQNPFSRIDKSKWLVNISNKQIPNSVSDFLCLGDKFALPINQFDKKDREISVLETIKNFEVNAHRFPENAVNSVRESLTDSLHRFLVNKNHVDLVDRCILNRYAECKKFLRENHDVFVTKADKGQVTVIMDRDEYLTKMTDLLKDESTYKKLKKDPIRQISLKLNELVRSWRDSGIIEDSDYKRLNCTNGNLPRCYGLPKIHKNGFPLRIIVSALGSPLYNVASFLHSILHHSIRPPKSHIKDSWSFVREIKDIEINTDEVLVSLDVTALFTNIPKELVLRGIEKRWQDISGNTKLNLPQFLHAIELVLGSTSFSFNGDTYEQIFGSPMGSPLSPILADIVMEDLETHCLAMLNFSLSFFRRYVDDVIAVIPKDKIGDVLDAFNNYHPRLKFTHELEGLSEDIRRTVNRCGLDVLYTIPKKMDSIIKRGKDKLDNMKETGVVYKIECNDCNVSYIGQTLRHLETRVKEHLGDIKKE
ncbi:uncharacterized protein LOC112454599, partial [Temnothorax curvispinosus]|uniref:Uncharacterized protein LOC112454599 n=2 Tax=Temnothorax curvispinosus TaxID=300111 RepID=A0A6J1PRH1_9HYME